MRRPFCASWIDMPSPMPPNPCSAWCAMSLKFHSIWSGMLTLSVVMGWVSLVRHGRARPGHPRLSCIKQDVDARHKAGHDGARRSRPRPCLLHEVRPQRLAPVRDGGDLLFLQQDLGLLLHVGLEVGGEARLDVDEAHR